MSVTCGWCRGSGKVPQFDAGPVDCSVCNGTGRKNAPHQMTPTLHRQDNGARFAILPSGHVIEELPNGGSIVHILLYGSVPCRESFTEALAQFGETP